MMSFLEALLLGLVQGISEFLPISSDGHLALAEMLFDVPEAGLTFNVMLHAGTLLATSLVLSQRLRIALVDGIRALGKPELFRTTPGGRDAAVVLVASVPTALVGFGLRDHVEVWTHSPTIVGLGFLGTAAALVSTIWAPRDGQKETITVPAALLVGVAQGLAVLPGLSRSGSTIAVLLFLGLRRDRAFELSMLMSVPAVFGAVLLELPRALGESSGAFGMAAAGALVAFLSGIVALLMLRRVVVSGRFSWFALWVLPVALATLAMARAWPG